MPYLQNYMLSIRLPSGVELGSVFAGGAHGNQVETWDVSLLVDKGIDSRENCLDPNLSSHQLCDCG